MACLSRQVQTIQDLCSYSGAAKEDEEDKEAAGEEEIVEKRLTADQEEQTQAEDWATT
jgi:hypothetical protein